MKKYIGLRVRPANYVEEDHFRKIWGEDFSGLVAQNETGTYVILKESKGWTPYGAYRISDTKHALIKAGYSQYDKIYLDGNNADNEVLDVEDCF